MIRPLEIHVLERSPIWLIELWEIITKLVLSRVTLHQELKSSRDEESENPRISGVLMSSDELSSF